MEKIGTKASIRNPDHKLDHSFCGRTASPVRQNHGVAMKTIRPLSRDFLKDRSFKNFQMYPEPCPYIKRSIQRNPKKVFQPHPPRHDPVPPFWCSANARFTATVLLPTPPLPGVWSGTTTNRLILCTKQPADWSKKHMLMLKKSFSLAPQLNLENVPFSSIRLFVSGGMRTQQ